MSTQERNNVGIEKMNYVLLAAQDLKFERWPVNRRRKRVGSNDSRKGKNPRKDILHKSVHKVNDMKGANYISYSLQYMIRCGLIHFSMIFQEYPQTVEIP